MGEANVTFVLHNIACLRYGIRIVRGDVVGTRPEVNVVPAETGEVRGPTPRLYRNTPGLYMHIFTL